MKRFVLPLLLAAAFCAGAARAQDNMPGRMYAVSVEGEVRTFTDGKMELLMPGEGGIAHRMRIEIGPHGKASFVLSNNTGLSFGPGTRLEILRFEHAPFTADPMKLDEEPTVSRLEARLRGGRVAVCLPSQVFGSTVTLYVPDASITFRGRRYMLDTSDERTVLHVVDGLATVFRGPDDRVGQVVGNGRSVTITSGVGPAYPLIEVGATEGAQQSAINEGLAAACLSRHTVFFATPSDPRRVVTPPNTAENPNPTVSLDRLP